MSRKKTPPPRPSDILPMSSWLQDGTVMAPEVKPATLEGWLGDARSAVNERRATVDRLAGLFGAYLTKRCLEERDPAELDGDLWN